MAASILIADDDPVQRRLVENMVQKCGYEAVVVENGDAVLAMLTGGDAAAIDAVVLDLVMPGLDGMGVLARMREAGLAIPVIVQTAHGGIDNVVSAMRAGAQDFVVKPVGLERLQVSLRNALAASALKGELQRIRHSREGRLTFNDIITRSEAMAAIMRTAQKAATSGIPVLIEGESGVGKELFARAIHGSGERRSNRSCSGTRRAPSPAPPSAISANSSRRAAARCSSTRSLNCRSPRRSSCCARCRKVRWRRSAGGNPSRSTSGSFPRPTASFWTMSKAGISGKICSTACTSCR
jgi:DNA-binding response OmpR family regulator